MYYDGQFDDSRMAVAIACTSAATGATILNHAEVIDLLREPSSGRIIGAKVRDVLTGDTFDVHAKVVINATGPFVDSIRYVVHHLFSLTGWNTSIFLLCMSRRKKIS